MKLTSLVVIRLLAVVGVASLAAAIPLPTLSGRWNGMLRALAFLAGCTICLSHAAGGAGPRAPSWGAAYQFAIAAALLFAGASALPSGPWGWTLLGSVILSAAVEEGVFRVQLPNAVSRLVASELDPPRALWLGSVAAQLCFASSHLALMGGAAAGSVETAARLAGAGCFLASIRMRGGLPLAVVVHALTNLGVLTAAGGYRQSPLVVLVLGALGLVHLTVSVAGGRAGESTVRC